MKSEDKFSLRRTLNLLRYYSIVEKKNILLYIAICLSSLQIPYIIAAYTFCSDHDNIHIEFHIKITIYLVGSIISFLLLAIAASNLIEKKSKVGICNHIMLPAKRSEKFFARILLCIVGSTALVGIGHLLGSATYSTTLYLVDAPTYLINCGTAFFRPYVEWPPDSKPAIFYFILLIYSIYIFCATYFRKNCFVRATSITLLSWAIPYIFVAFLIHWLEDKHSVISIIKNIILILPFILIWLSWRNFKNTNIIKRERYILILSTIFIIYAALALGLISERNNNIKKIEIKQERIERITGVKFPKYEYGAPLSYQDGGFLGDFTTVSSYKFTNDPTDDFYNTLDSLCNLENSYWSKNNIPRDKDNPTLGTVNEYKYSRIWGNGISAPAGEKEKDDRLIEITIIKGVKGFKITYGAW